MKNIYLILLLCGLSYEWFFKDIITWEFVKYCLYFLAAIFLLIISICAMSILDEIILDERYPDNWLKKVVKKFNNLSK